MTDKGTITCEHVVNAAGLWAKQVGRMAGIELPVSPLKHHYLILDSIPQVAELDVDRADALSQYVSRRTEAGGAHPVS